MPFLQESLKWDELEKSDWLELISSNFSFYIQLFKTSLFLTFSQIFKIWVYFSILSAKS